jgi:hypothetical protein
MKTWLSRPYAPFLTALGLGAAVVLFALAVPLWTWWRGAPPGPTAATTGSPAATAAVPAPWAAQVEGGRLSLLGLQLPGSRWGDVAARWGDGVQLAVMAQRDLAGRLEAYVERVEAAGALGRLVLAFDLPDDSLLALQQGAAKAEPVDGVVWRHLMRGEQRQQLEAAPVKSLSFVVSTRLDAATLRQRYGAPAERWLENTPAGGAPLRHWLYPERGLALVVDPAGRHVLQAVAPAAFEALLRAPLMAAGARKLADDAPD